MSSTRDQALRRILVAQADAPPSRRPWKLAALSVGAFAVAGALTGGTLTAFTGLGSSAPADPVTIEFDYVTQLITDDVRVLGAPIMSSGQQTYTIDLDAAPQGANGLALAMRCVDVAEYRVLLDGRFELGLQCIEEEGRPVSGGAGGIINFDSAPRELTIEVDHGSYAIAALWVEQPPPAEPSATQQEALADGVVTREEYLAGFDAFVACMAEAGFEVYGPGSRDQEVLSYSMDGAAGESGASTRCYDEHFHLVDVEWQLAHEG